MKTLLSGQVRLAPSEVAQLQIIATHATTPSRQWTARPDDRGQFTLGTQDHAELRTNERTLPIIVRVLDGTHVVGRASVIVDLRALRPATVAIDLIDGTGPWVGGIVRTDDGRPARDLTIIVTRVTPEDLDTVGRAQTDRDGQWSTRVTATARGPLDLRVTVLDASGNQLTTGSLHCDVEDELEEDLTVPSASVPRRTVAADLRERVAEQLGDTPLVDIDDDRLELIGRRCGAPTSDLEHLRESLRWEAAGANADVAFAIARAGELTARSLLASSISALTRTVATAVDNAVVADADDALPRHIAQLRQTAAALAVQQPHGLRQRAWLVDIGVPADAAREVVLRDSLGDLEEPAQWDAMIADFGRDAVEDARDGLTLQRIGIEHPPLTRQLLVRRRTQRAETIERMLPRLAQAEIEVLVTEQGVPAEHEAAGGTASTYARGVMRRIERRYPTATALHSWARLTQSPVVSELADLNPDLDLAQLRLDRQGPQARLTLPPDAPEDVVDQLRAAQRLFAVAPPGRRIESMRALHGANFTSATAITRRGRVMFERAVSDALEPAVARTVYAQAAERSATATALMLRHYPTLENYGGAAALQGSTANLELLLGPMSFCSCEHCRSVFSPAAYLAELLEFIQRIPVGSGSAFELLTDGRGRYDVTGLQLNCTNTTTPLPYIDLVNELLEVRMLSFGDDPDHPAQRRQTRWTQDELTAHPEHLATPAYIRLRDAAVFPMSLPFDLFAVEVRAYLAHLGVSWSELVQLTQPESVQAQLRSAAARLNLSPPQTRIVVGDHPGSVPSMWGVDSFILQRTALGMMNQADLSHDELRELITTRFFRGTRLPGMEALDVEISYPEPCSLEGAVLTGLPSSMTNLMDRTHRLLRVWRASGWSLRELDLAMLNVGSHNLTAQDVIAMGTVAELGARFASVPRLEMLVWWGLLETRDGIDDARSQFRDVFSGYPQSYGASVPLNVFLLNEAGTRLALVGQPIASLLAEIAGALGLTSTGLTALLDALGDSAPDVVTLPSLSRLYRHVSLSRALKMSPTELQGWVNLLAIDPFDTPQRTLALVNARQEIVERGFSLAQLQWLLAGDEAAATAPTAIAIARLLVVTVVAMQAASEPNVTAESSAVDRLGAQLHALVEEAAAADLLALFVEPLPQADADEPPFDPRPIIADAVGGWISSDVLSATAQDLVDGEVEQAADRLATALAAPGRRARLQRAASTTLANALNLDVATARLLLELQDTGAVPGETLLETLTADAVVELLALDDPTARIHPDLIALVPVVRRWSRTAALVDALALPIEATRWLIDNAAALGAVSPTAVSEGSLGDAAVRRTFTFADLVASSDWSDVQSLYAEALQDLEAPASEAATNVLASAMQRDDGDVAFWAEQLGLTHTDVVEGRAAGRIRAAIELLARGDLERQAAIDWASADPTPEVADAVKQLATARVPRGQRGAVLGPVRDPIREQQRDALLAAYLQRTGLPSHDVYATLLIDPQMSSCRSASRVQQAIAAVQRLVHLIEGGHEVGGSLPDDVRQEWEWMRAYRVWEANRKVFIWPENWLDPQLRLDRTPLFDDAVASLQGTELSSDDGEAAVQQYLFGLRAIARLDVVGLHYDDHNDRLDLFGRGQESTKNWYHRQYERGSWTPWRSVPLQIDAPEVLPVTYRGQLMVIWPFVEQGNPSDAEDDRPPYAQVGLAWSYKEDSGWSEPRRTAPGDGVDYVVGGSLTAPLELVSGFVIANATSEPKVREQPQDARDLRLSATVGDQVTITPLAHLRSLDTPSKHWALDSFVSDPCGLGFSLGPPSVGDVTLWGPSWTSAHSQSFKTNPNGTDFLRIRPSDGGGGFALTQHLLQLAGDFRFIAAVERPLDGAADGPDYTRPAIFTQASRPLLMSRLVQALGNGELESGFRFDLVYHPFVCELLEQLERSGVEGIYRPALSGPGSELNRQNMRRELDDLTPLNDVPISMTEESFEFTVGSAFGEYNWELFFHLPLLIATKLRTAGKFAKAKAWLERVFDPAGRDLSSPNEAQGASRHWLTKPLFAAGQTSSIEEDLAVLNTPPGTQVRRKGALKALIRRWRERPFEPHLIAAVRPGAYQRQALMMYLDTLLEWADSLFARRTAEALDEATQLYLLAARLLGPRPEGLASREVASVSFDEISAIDAFGNALVEIEDSLPASDAEASSLGPSDGDADDDHDFDPLTTEGLDIPPTHPIDFHDFTSIGVLTGLAPASGATTRVPYFCIPPNEKLLGYWDRVADRLFKLRNCLDLQGQTLNLDLFAPPIDPAALVAAIAGGADLASAIDDLYAPLPHYRFDAALRRARDLSALVRDLGRSVLSALERGDTERAALTSNAAEAVVLGAVCDVHAQKIAEARAQLDVLGRASATVDARKRHYEMLLGNDLLESESAQLRHKSDALASDLQAASFQRTAGIINSVPSFMYSLQAPPAAPVLVGGSVTTSYGTSQITNTFVALAENKAALARRQGSHGDLQGTRASHERRTEQWRFERDQAELELERIDADKATAKLRLVVAQREQTVHQRNVQTNRVIREHLERKYTRAELHDWMADSAAQVHQAGFNLALDLARKAQRVYRYDLAEPTADFIRTNYWESNRNGLFAGERLALDLARMEAAYVENNRREHELLKRVSLAQIDPGALLQLRYGGSCEFAVPEVLFDLDQPNHYLRRLRRVTITIPAVAGPYTNVNATLTLTRSQTRPTANGEPVVDYAGGASSIAISTGQSDAGVFTDAAADPRRMPFEGRGAVSRWQLSLPQLAQFNYRSIADVILELRYTARSGGTTSSGLVDALNARALSVGTGWARSWNVRAEFPDAWQAFRQPTDPELTEQGPTLVMALQDGHYPFPLQRGAARQTAQVHIYAETDAAPSDLGTVSVSRDETTTDAEFGVSFEGTLVATAAFIDDAIGPLTLQFEAGVDPSIIGDLVVLVEYTVTPGPATGPTP